MIRKFLCLILSVVCASVAAVAEDDKEKMNNIKMDPAYYWGEATSDDKSVASSDAMYILVETMVADNIAVKEEQLKGSVEYLYIPRGERIRAFAYILKSKLASLPPADTGSEKKAANVTKPMQTELPTQTIAKKPEPVDESPVGTPKGGTNITAVLMTLSQCQQASDALRCLKEYQQSGNISECGKVTCKAQLSESNYLVIFDDSMSIQAILAPAEGSARKNCVSGEMDSMNNYKGCGALWFR